MGSAPAEWHKEHRQNVTPAADAKPLPDFDRRP
jgi:hypothetical protein